MEKQVRSDLKINGTGNTSGGKFNDVVINGVGNIDGDIECVSFKSNGVSNIKGNMKARSAKVNGSSSMKGDINSDEFKINGTAEIHGNIRSKDSRVHGALKVTGNITSDIVDLHGGLNVSGDCNAEDFSSNGGFSVVGLLNADRINIKLHGPCSAKEIGGENIVVKLGNEFAIKKFIKSIFPSWNLGKRLTSDIIEGDDIELEGTKAKIVRGNNIIIGEGCEIDLVEYRKSYNLQSKNSTVKENKKI
jgi:cytoskeletal protein CcmA (bactofilin family)